MHNRGFVQSEVMEESAGMGHREDVDPRESFPMHFADDTDEGDYWSPFFLPRVPWSHAPFGGGRGRGFGRRGRGMMMMMMDDPRGTMFLPRPMFHPGGPFPVFGGRGRGGWRGRGTGRGRGGGGCGRGGWRAFNDAMVERFKHCRLTEDPTTDNDTSGSGESDTGEAVEVDVQHDNPADRRDDGVSSHQATTSNLNEPTADGDGEIPSPPPHRRRCHPRLHHRHHGHGMKHHGPPPPPPPAAPLQHPYFRARFPDMPPVWQPFNDCDQQGNCKKCFKKSMKMSFKAHKKAWKRCTKKCQKGTWKSDGEGIHSDDAEAGEDSEEFPTSPYPWGYFSHPWGYFPPHFLHRELRRRLRRSAGRHFHGGKGKRCGHGCCQQGEPSTTNEQQQATGDERCDVIDDDTMLMDDGDHDAAAEPKSPANTTENPASGTSGKK